MVIISEYLIFYVSNKHLSEKKIDVYVPHALPSSQREEQVVTTEDMVPDGSDARWLNWGRPINE